ncbi:MAG: hypothetical protein A2Z88_06555 [Omnitrophica WOR_2 bacterium GWA2_47_8]|nr:MAG: hypothetical protein A2Z88_06555 [Omnitrophica WOR_2 bacterium GWA2_47_8]
MTDQILQVGEEHHNVRLDVYLTKVLANVPSRTYIKRLIDAGEVRVNSKTAKANHKVQTGDSVDIHVAEDFQLSDLKAENIPLDIFYEDENLVIINKPSGMLVHPINQYQTGGTLVNALLYHCQQLSKVNSDIRPGIVHRLDRETSGLLAAAKDTQTHVRLSRQFEKHKVFKQYAALVEGHIAFEEGLIDASIGTHPRFHDRKRISYDEKAKEAVTLYRVRKRFKNSTLVDLFPQTGRTHQLRVHLAHLGHPILGDEKYGKKEAFPRLALHAQSLGFAHPIKGDYLEFVCALPKEFLMPPENQ